MVDFLCKVVDPSARRWVGVSRQNSDEVVFWRSGIDHGSVSREDHCPFHKIEIENHLNYHLDDFGVRYMGVS